MTLTLVTDRLSFDPEVARIVTLALQGGVCTVQIREKDLPPPDLLALARDLRAITRSFGAKLIINHDLEVALAANADGVHLGYRSVSVRDARNAGGDLLVGCSTHSLLEARQAEEAGADYVIFGPIFSTPSKVGLVKPQGVERLRNVAKTLSIPVIAIGGIDTHRVADVMNAGAGGIAVIRAIAGAASIESAARGLRESLMKQSKPE